MFRLLDFPEPIRLSRVTWLTGPNARNSGSNTVSDGSEQTYTGIGNIVSFRLDYTLKMKREARRERGFLTALMSGANAARFKFVDGDGLSPEEAGLIMPKKQFWANGEPWANGKRWGVSYPEIPVAANSSYDTGIIKLSDLFWGHHLGIGDYIGFFPFHFGLYMVTEVFDGGIYRIWPRLRKAITPDDFATLHPTLVMKTMPDGISMARGPVHTENQGVTLVEVVDKYVRRDFSDTLETPQPV